MSPPSRRPSASAAVAALLLSGCLAPKYRRPTLDAPAAFKEAGDWKPAGPADSLPKGAWWTLFNDPRLDALERRAAEANQTIAQAEAQYRQARALVSQANSAYLPSVTAQPSMTRQRGGAGTPHTYSNNFNLPLTASWEPDFWGVITLSARAAKNSAQASAAQLEGVRLSVQAELAADYFALAELDVEESLLNVSTGSYAQALALTQVRFNSGISAQTDVSQAQAQLDSTRAQATDVALRRAQLEHALAVLSGQPPAAFSLSTGTLPGGPPAIPAALPARLLERRPDVAAAERGVAAANANIGLTRAAYFPLITLTAVGGYQNGSLAQWIDWPSRVWSLGAAASATVFDFGRHRAQNAQAWALYDEAVARYRQTVLGAFQEVEDNLSALTLLSKEAEQQSSAAKAAENALRLELDRYKAGIVSYLDVIQTQNIALSNERAAEQSRGRQMAAAVALIRALGGGWDVSQLPYSSTPPTPSK